MMIGGCVVSVTRPKDRLTLTIEIDSDSDERVTGVIVGRLVVIEDIDSVRSSGVDAMSAYPQLTSDMSLEERHALITKWLEPRSVDFGDDKTGTYVAQGNMSGDADDE